LNWFMGVILASVVRRDRRASRRRGSFRRYSNPLCREGANLEVRG